MLSVCRLQVQAGSLLVEFKRGTEAEFSPDSHANDVWRRTFKSTAASEDEVLLLSESTEKLKVEEEEEEEKESAAEGKRAKGPENTPGNCFQMQRASHGWIL